MCSSCPSCRIASLFVPLLWDSERDGVVKISRISSKHGHIFSAASPGTASGRSRKIKPHGAVFTCPIQNRSVWSHSLKLEKNKKPNTRSNILATSGTAKKQKRQKTPALHPHGRRWTQRFWVTFQKGGRWEVILGCKVWGRVEHTRFSPLCHHVLGGRRPFHGQGWLQDFARWRGAVSNPSCASSLITSNGLSLVGLLTAVMWTRQRRGTRELFPFSTDGAGILELLLPSLQGDSNETWSGK